MKERRRRKLEETGFQAPESEGQYNYASTSELDVSIHEGSDSEAEDPSGAANQPHSPMDVQHPRGVGGGKGLVRNGNGDGGPHDSALAAEPNSALSGSPAGAPIFAHSGMRGHAPSTDALSPASIQSHLAAAQSTSSLAGEPSRAIPRMSSSDSLGAAAAAMASSSSSSRPRSPLPAACRGSPRPRLSGDAQVHHSAPASRPTLSRATSTIISPAESNASLTEDVTRLGLAVSSVQSPPPPPPPLSLTAFLGIYERAACIFRTSDSALVFANAAFERMRDTRCRELAGLVAQALGRLPAREPAQRTQEMHVTQADFTIRWTCTFDGDFVVLLTTQVLDAGLHHGGPSRVQAPTTLRIDRAGAMQAYDWRENPRFSMIATGGGEMGELIRGFNWAITPVGPIEGWCDTLLSKLGMMLHTRFPMTMYWGPECTTFYNDGFIPVAGFIKHPHEILGRTIEYAWGEIYDTLHPARMRALNGEFSWFETYLLLCMRMRGGPQPLEESWLTWSFTPLHTPDGVISGILVPVMDQSRQVIQSRRLDALRELGVKLAGAADIFDLCRFSCQVLSNISMDLPFGMAYTCETTEEKDNLHIMPHVVVTSGAGGSGQAAPPSASASPQLGFKANNSHSGGSKSDGAGAPQQRKTLSFTLQETIGVPFDSPAAPSKITMPLGESTAHGSNSRLSEGGEQALAWPLAKMYRTKSMIIVDDCTELLQRSVPEPRGHVGIWPHKAACIPLLHGSQVVGCFIFFLDPCLPIDSTFRLFLDILSRQLSTCLSAIKTLEAQMQKSEELAALDQAKTAFFTSISHELRTPLTLILGPCDSLLDSLTADEQRHSRHEVTEAQIEFGNGLSLADDDTDSSNINNYNNSMAESSNSSGASGNSVIAFPNNSAGDSVPLLQRLLEQERYAVGVTRARKGQVSIIKRNARRLLTLVNSILDFSKAEAGRLVAHFQPLHLAEYTEDLASVFRSAAESAGLAFHVSSRCTGAGGGPDGKGPIVWADKDKWEKILFNLVGNALKFTLQGSIRIETAVEDGHFTLCVSDSGMGIPPNELSSIFQKFHRVESTAARSIEGSGIGLALTLELVKAHGGNIIVDSVWQSGSSFKVYIPMGNAHLPTQSLLMDEQQQQQQQQHQNQHHSPTAAAVGRGRDNSRAFADMVESSVPAMLGNIERLVGSGSHPALALQQARSEQGAASEVTNETLFATTNSGSGESQLVHILFKGVDRKECKVLLVDDNADMRRYVRGILAKFCEVTEACDGADAWARIADDGLEPDLILSDWMMPNVSGPQLLKLVRAAAGESLKRTPFILLSARAGEQERVEGLAATADDYLAKPFSAKELLLRVHTHLQLGKMRRELEARVESRTRALVESQESYKNLTEVLQVGIHKADVQGVVTWVNRRWSSVIGIGRDQWDSWQRAIHPEDRDGAVEAYAHAIQTQEGYTREMRIVSGSLRKGALSIVYDLRPHKDPNTGQVIGFIGVFNEVTELRRLEREHLEAERQRTQEAERNRMLQEQFIDVTCHELRNPLNAICNNAELLGESLHELIGFSGEILSGHGEMLAAAPRLAEILRVSRLQLADNLEAVETILLCAKHQKRIADDVLNISKLSGDLIVLVNSVFDPREELTNVMRTFKHELNARKIQLNFSLHPSWELVASAWGNRVEADPGRFGQVLINLVSNAIKFTESSPRRQITVALGALPEYAQPAAPTSSNGGGSGIGAMAMAAGEDDMASMGSVGSAGNSPSTSPSLSASSSSICSYPLQELLPHCNAFMIANAGRPIDGARMQAIRVHVAVADTGHGMSSEEQKRIFRRFAQASPKTYGEFGGTGLGLYISRKLVELQGGEITLQSEKEVGTVFRFFVKMRRENHAQGTVESAAMEALKPRPVGSSFGGRSVASESNASLAASPAIGTSAAVPRAMRVLVVEDNKVNQRVLQRLLETLHCDVSTADNGELAIEVLKNALDKSTEEEFEVVLMDLEMPIMDGLSATKIIRELEGGGKLFRRPLKIIAVSGNARQEYSDKARAVGMNGFLRKPYSKADLKEILHL